MGKIVNLDDHREQNYIVMETGDRTRWVPLSLLLEIANGDMKPQDVEQANLFFQDVTIALLNCLDDLGELPQD